MRLGVNAVRLTRPFTGVGRYLECVLLEWSRREIPFHEVLLYAPAPLRRDAVRFPLDRYPVRVLGKPMPDPLWELRHLRRVEDEVDVLYCPSYTLPLGYRGRSLVANLGPAENVFPGYQWWRGRAYEALYRWSARRASVVCACSQAVKRRVVAAYGIPESRVHVTFLAASDAFAPVEDPERLAAVRRRLFGQDRPFILFVGKMARRHCIPELIDAFGSLRQKRQLPHGLALIGPDYLPLHVGRLAARRGLAEHVVHVPFLKHAELPEVYSAADLFVFPVTEAEGFGIPVVEAMACGTPVVSVEQGSVREFGPGAALLVKEPTAAELADGMARLLHDEELRAELRREGFARAKSITWRRTADRTMELLWELASRSRA